MTNENAIKSESNDRVSLADLIKNLKEGEILDLFRDTCAKYYFSNSRYPVNTNALVAILLDIDYKDLVGNVKSLPLEDKGLTLGQNEIIRDTFFEINLNGKLFYLIVEFNRFYEDMKKVNYSNKKILNNAINKAKFNQLLKTYYYQCRTYGTVKVKDNDYINVNRVIAINLSTFSIDKKYIDDLAEFVMMNPKNNLKLTDNTKFYNLDIANKGREWYTDKYQESNKHEKNLIAFSKLLTTTSMEVAKECIDSLDIGMSEKEKMEMKGVLNIMFDKDNSELLTVEEYSKLQNKKHEEEFEFFRRELLKLEKEESHKEGREEGSEETQRNMIINLNKENVSLDVIAKASNLSLDKVKSIISTYCNN